MQHIHTRYDNSKIAHPLFTPSTADKRLRTTITKTNYEWGRVCEQKLNWCDEAWRPIGNITASKPTILAHILIPRGAELPVHVRHHLDDIISLADLDIDSSQDYAIRKFSDEDFQRTKKSRHREDQELKSIPLELA